MVRKGLWLLIFRDIFSCLGFTLIGGWAIVTDCFGVEIGCFGIAPGCLVVVTAVAGLGCCMSVCSGVLGSVAIRANSTGDCRCFEGGKYDLWLSKYEFMPSSEADNPDCISKLSRTFILASDAAMSASSSASSIFEFKINLCCSRACLACNASLRANSAA